MPTCQFENCDQPCLPIIDKESTITVDSVSASHGEVVKRKIHPIIGHKKYCYYHDFIMKGRSSPSTYTKMNFETGQKLRHKQNLFNIQFMKKKL